MKKVCYFIKTVWDVFTSYFLGQGLVILILCVLYSTALVFIIGKFGILIGILVGLLSIVPYLGFTVGLVISIIIAAIQHHDFLHVFYVILAFALIQILESFFITPKIVGKSVGINPFVVLGLLIVGGMAFGPLGMLISVPAAGVLIKIYRDRVKKAESEVIVAPPAE